MPGPFSLQAELMQSKDRRRRQGPRSTDLPDLLACGWYGSVAWVITGESKAGGVETRRRWGALEVTGRYEALSFRSAIRDAAPDSGRRSVNFASAADRVATYGFNWYVGRFFKIQLNRIREIAEDVERYDPADRMRFNGWLARIQFVL
jgi:phosphate-selective porin